MNIMSIIETKSSRFQRFQDRVMKNLRISDILLSFFPTWWGKETLLPRSWRSPICPKFVTHAFKIHLQKRGGKEFRSRGKLREQCQLHCKVNAIIMFAWFIELQFLWTITSIVSPTDSPWHFQTGNIWTLLVSQSNWPCSRHFSRRGPWLNFSSRSESSYHLFRHHMKRICPPQHSNIQVHGTLLVLVRIVVQRTLQSDGHDRQIEYVVSINNS